MSLLQRLLPAGTSRIAGALDPDRSLLGNVRSLGNAIGDAKALISQLQSGGFETRFKDYLRDPTKYLFLLDVITRDNPVKMVQSVTTEEMSSLREIMNKVLGRHSSGALIDSIFMDTTPTGGLARSALYKIFGKIDNSVSNQVKQALEQAATKAGDKSALELRFDNELPYKVDSKSKSVKDYMELRDPYDADYKAVSPAEAVKHALNTMGANFGYKRWAGFEIGSDHLWDIQIYPYKGYDGKLKTFTPELPKYSLPGFYKDPKDPEKYSEISEFSFGANCPAIGYNLNYGTMKSKDLRLFNGSTAYMPSGFNYEMYLGLDIVDDVHGSFRMYMNKYMNSIYNMDTLKLARYDQAAMELILRIFKPGYNTKFAAKFVVVPYNYTPTYDGGDSPDECRVHIDFSVIGMRPYVQNGGPITSLTSQALSNMQRTWETSTWTDVVIQNKPQDTKKNRWKPTGGDQLNEKIGVDTDLESYLQSSSVNDVASGVLNIFKK